MAQKIVRLQQGDSFSMNFVLKENGVPTSIDVQGGEDLAVGFYTEQGGKVILKLSTGDIVFTGTAGYYTAAISPSITKNFIGYVDIEIVVYNSSGDEVSHADKVLKMYFEERRINDDI